MQMTFAVPFIYIKSATLPDPVSFYAVLPAGTYAVGTTFQFKQTNGTVIEKKTLEEFTVNRAQILNLPTVYVAQ